MSSRNLELHLDDILASIQKIERYTINMTFDSFVADERTFDAVAHNLQIIGEAVKNIPDSVRMVYPQIEWRKIAGLRDILAHAYFSVDDEILWNIVQAKLTDLKECIIQIKSNP